MEDVLFSWSGGKDSAMALRELQASGRYRVAALLTTVSKDYDRISMHGVRRTLLQKQAEMLGLPLAEVRLPKQVTNEEYEQIMLRTLTSFKASSVTAVAFGDIFLEDLRRYREKNLAQLGLRAIFPIWKRDTRELLNDFMTSGFRAVTVCVDTHALSREFAGRTLDARFVSDLPEGVDACGENGEYHTFVYDGPLFPGAIPHVQGEVVLRENRFCFCDLLPG